MVKCVTGKKAYPSQQIAEDVLIELWTLNHYTPSNGPIGIYHCDDCGQYHFTSQGKMNDKLAQYLADGRIERQREAEKWQQKFKKR
ncbi:MAG: hypothetical protein ACOYXT_14680 [Bacteroidota bacterium]